MRSITAEMQRAAGRLIALRGVRSSGGEPRLGISVVTETYVPEINGVAHTVHRTVAWLCERGHGVQLVRPRQPEQGAAPRSRVVSEFLTRGMRVPMYPDVRVGLGSRSTLARLWTLARPDVVHIATEGPLGYAALAAARRLRIPVTSDFRTNFHLYGEHYRLGWSRPLALSYLRWFHNHTALTMVPTARLADELAAQGFNGLRVVGRGVDTALFSPDRRSDELRAHWGAGPDDPVVIHVGRLAAEKNVTLVLRAYDALRQRVPRARLVLVGDGPLRGELQAARPDVVFAGWHRDEALARCYASGDFFLFASLTETFGNVVVEALASGLAVVAFARGAAAAVVCDGGSGYLAPALTDEAFVATALRALAAAPADAAALRRQARAAAVELRWERVLGEFEAALLSVVPRFRSGHAEDFAGAA